MAERATSRGAGGIDPDRRRLLQFLEPTPALDEADPAELAGHLEAALAQLEPTDLALGWRLRPTVVAALRTLIPDDVTLWRWVPMLTDSGVGPPATEKPAVGITGRAPIPFRGMNDFRFLCLDDDDVVQASLEHAVNLAAEVGAAGVLLDRIRWHSPSQAPVAELTCFCDRSRELASEVGLDLDQVTSELVAKSRSLEGRQSIVRAVLGGGGGGALAEFLSWRRERVTGVVTHLVDALAKRGLRSALDVFTPALAHSVGQDLAALGALGEWAKSMTYLDAVGPATLPYELRGYARWLEEVGDKDAPTFISEVIGFEAPGLIGSGARLDALRVEMARLSDAVGRKRAVLGLDAVEIPGVCEIRDDDLVARLKAIQKAGLGVAPSWELLAMGPERIGLLAETLQR